MKDPWPKAFDPETIASIQTIQDSLSGLSALYLAVLDPVGVPLTIPSNQAPRCADCQCRFAEAPCLPNFRQAIADAAGSRSTTQAQCPFGLVTYFSPLGTQGNPARGNPAALLAIGKLPPAEGHGSGRAGDGDGLAPAHADKTVTTFCRIFDLIFSLALHAGPHGAQAMAPAAPAAGAASLSVREREVLHLVAMGLPNRTIADRLFISEPTVKTHIHNISRKVKINNRTSLALFFLQSM